MSDNSEILIIRRLKRAVPRAEVLPFARRKVSAVKQIDLGNFLLHYEYSVQLVGNNCLTQGRFEKAFKSVCTPIVVVSPDHLPPAPPTSSGMKTPGSR